MSGTCLVAPRDLISVEVAAEHVDAHTQTLSTRCTLAVLLAPKGGLRWLTHRLDSRTSVRPGNPAPAATLPAIPSAGESATSSRHRSTSWDSPRNSPPRQSQWHLDINRF